MPKEFTGTSTLAGHEVILQQGSTRLSATTDANGVATFNGIIPDVYDISCSWEITEAEYHQATGSNQSVSGCTVSGSQNSLLIKEEQTILVYGVLACLKGLKEQGCNGPVTDAINTIEKHINKLAHK
jgi:hypothetical protein